MSAQPDIELQRSPTLPPPPSDGGPRPVAEFATSSGSTWRTIIASTFGPSMVGVLMLGTGATATWITVGIPHEPSHTAIRGTDLPDGIIVLACALVALIAATVGRFRVSRWTTIASWFTAGAGATSIAVALAFLIDGRNRHVVIKALGIPPDIWAQVGAFRDPSIGPFLALGGGVLCLFLGVRMALARPSSSFASSLAAAPSPDPGRQQRQ